MSNPAVSPQDRQRFFLQARTPVRAYALSAVGSVLGAVLLVATLTLEWPRVLVVLGIILMAFGIALSTAALFAKARYRTTLLVERDSITLINGRRRRVLNWTEVGDVTVQGPHLVFAPRDASGRREIVLFDPRQTDSPLFQDLVAALRHRLDVSRGYRPL
jgi:hypothetical protein